MGKNKKIRNKFFVVMMVIIGIGLAISFLGFMLFPSQGKNIIGDGGFIIKEKIEITNSQQEADKYLISIKGKIGAEENELRNVKVYVELSTEDDMHTEEYILNGYTVEKGSKVVEVTNAEFNYNYTKITKIYYSHSLTIGKKEIENVKYDAYVQPNPDHMGQYMAITGIAITFGGVFILLIGNAVLIIVRARGRKNIPEEQNEENKDKPVLDYRGKACPFCGEVITIKTNRCPNCKAKLD